MTPSWEIIRLLSFLVCLPKQKLLKKKKKKIPCTLHCFHFQCSVILQWQAKEKQEEDCCVQCALKIRFSFTYLTHRNQVVCLDTVCFFTAKSSLSNYLNLGKVKRHNVYLPRSASLFQPGRQEVTFTKCMLWKPKHVLATWFDFKVSLEEYNRWDA